MKKQILVGLVLVAAALPAACGGGGETGSSSGSGGSASSSSESSSRSSSSASTSASSGSGGGTGSDLGKACMTKADCKTGDCFDETSAGWPSGGCVGACNLQVATCDNGNGACVDDGTGTGVCVKSCKMGGNDCRDGYACVDYNGDGSALICLPACTKDLQCPTVGSCNTKSGFCVAPETDCGNLKDDDQDKLTDCEDPSTCKGTAACMSGNTDTGHPCAKPSDCKAKGGDPECLSDTGKGWPMGYCTEFCDIMANDCISPSSVCIDANLPSGAGLCLHTCATAADCPTAGYKCGTAGGKQVCLPSCTADAQCGKACNLDTGFCTQTKENCSDGMDNDGDGLIDCEDLDCAATCMAQIGMACGSAPVAMATTMGDTTGGTNLFAGSCTGSGSHERLFTFTPGMAGEVGSLDVTLSSMTDQGIYVRTTCGDDKTEIACVDDNPGGMDEHLSVVVQGGVPVTIFVDGFMPGGEGAFSLKTAFTAAVCGDGKVTPPEECDDGNTMAGDGCDATCHVELSFYCMNAAAAMIGANPGDTTGGTNLFSGSCSGAGSHERLFNITPAMSGTLHIVLASATDQGIYVRTTCVDDKSEIGCKDANPGGMNETLDVPVTAGTPVTIFVDGYQPGEEGPFTLTLSLM